MADHSTAMTIARATIVQIRLQGLALAAMVEKGVLNGAQAAALVRDAAGFLHAETNDPTTEELLVSAYEEVARNLATHRPQ